MEPNHKLNPTYLTLIIIGQYQNQQHIFFSPSRGLVQVRVANRGTQHCGEALISKTNFWAAGR